MRVKRYFGMKKFPRCSARADESSWAIHFGRVLSGKKREIDRINLPEIHMWVIMSVYIINRNNFIKS
jgi:hypothetical protein